MSGIVFSSRREQPTWVPPVERFLAYLHGGRIFTETLPYLARAALVLEGLGLAALWLGSWDTIFRDYERWRLVGAALVHCAFLALAYVFGRVAWLRIGHLRRLPQGESVALRSLPILLRSAAELGLVFSVALAVRVFFMPSGSWPQAFGEGEPGFLSNSAVDPVGWFRFGAGSVLWVALCSVLGLVVFYGLANAIETYLAIELNTRAHPARKSSDDSPIRHGDA